MISNLIRIELLRNLKSWKSLIAFFIILTSYILTINHFKPNTTDIPVESYNFYTGFLYASGAGPKSVISILIPIVAALFAGDSLAWDRKTKFGEYTLFRTTYNKYIFSKILSVSLSSFLFVFLSIVAGLLYSYISLPNYTNPTNMEGYVPTFANELFKYNIFLHLFFIVFNISLLAMILSSISLMISTKIKNIYVVIISPLLLFIIGDFVLRGLGLSKYAPFEMAGSYLLNNFIYQTFEIPFIFISLWMVICIISYFLYTKSYKLGVHKVEKSYN